MKTRLDFVTNSSSSSFIVATKHPIVDMDSVKYLLELDSDEEWKHDFVLRDALDQKPVILPEYPNELSKNDIAAVLGNEWVGSYRLKPHDYHDDEISEISFKFDNMVYGGLPKGMTDEQYEKLSSQEKIAACKKAAEEQRIEHDILQKRYNDRIEISINKWIARQQKWGRKYFYKFEYSDNDGKQGSDLEHRGTFDNCEHISFSHH